MNGILIDRVRSFAAEFVVDEETRSRVQQYIVHPATEAVNTPAPMETSTEPDRQSISNDSEFSDAISEFPSTSSAPKLSTDTNEPQNWQSIMPSEWVSALKGFYICSSFLTVNNYFRFQSSLKILTNKRT